MTAHGHEPFRCLEDIEGCGAVVRIKQLEQEVATLRQRLQVDPGGGDLIDAQETTIEHLRARGSAEINNWDVLKTMSARNMDIGLAPLSNLEGATYNQRKGGSLVRIGYPGNILAGIARHEYIGGLILANAEQYEQVRKELEEAALAAKG